jgi:hypothetical protein
MFFYHITPTVLADSNIYLLWERKDISKEKEKETYVRFYIKFCIIDFHSFYFLLFLFVFFIYFYPFFVLKVLSFKKFFA